MPAKFLASFTDRLMGNDDPPLRQKILHHPQAEWELEIEPDGVGDHIWWKSVAAIDRGVFLGGHAEQWHSFYFNALKFTVP